MSTPPTVLFICTGKLCRSVMAQSMLEARVEASDVALTIGSAGLAAEGLAPPRHTVALMRDRGLDVTTHRSRRLREPLIDQADLILGTARIHAWEAVALQPAAVRRVFTLKEFVRLAGSLDDAAEPIQLDDLTRRVQERRRRSDALDYDDDIDDPYLHSRRRYARVAAEIESLVEQLWTVMAPALPSTGVHEARSADDKNQSSATPL